MMDIYTKSRALLAARLVSVLSKKGLKVATAESCTGGMISAAVTSVSGASAVFDGGLCSYSNEVKARLLTVPEGTLSTVGAVSAATAAAMAKGALSLFSADVALSVTGIAGPGGGSAEKPVGTVYIAAATKYHCVVMHHRFSGDRETVRAKAAVAALTLALETAAEM